MQTTYEWDYETTDDNGDILDHSHSEKLSDFTDADKTETLVLVRDSGDEINGLDDRAWAYVKDGKLPIFFKDSAGIDTYKVPNRFHSELSKYLK